MQLSFFSVCYLVGLLGIYPYLVLGFLGTLTRSSKLEQAGFSQTPMGWGNCI
jgi:hypothetical protein